MKENNILFKNTIIYTIGGIGSKLCGYFLVPLYTLGMSVAEYGVADLYYLTIQIACVIGTVKIASALVRFVLEDKSKAKDIFTATFKVIIVATMIMTALYVMLGDRYFGKYEIPIWLFPLLFFACAFREICAELTKALDKNRAYVVGGMIQSVVLLGTSYIFLFILDHGIRGYIGALVLANFASAVYYSIRIQIGQFIDIRLKSKNTIESMIRYSAFLVPAALAYWIIQASDRYMINYYIGNSAAGLYGVAYKIPGICTTFANFFFSAWYISAIHEKENKDYYSEVFSNFFNFVTLLATGIILFDRLLAKILFQKDFYQAWKYAPILIAASLFSICYSFFEVIFAVYKDTKAIFFTTAVGAGVNIILNCILIQLWGIYGAAVSTLISMMIVFFSRYFYISKRKYIQMHNKDAILNSILTLVFAFTYSFVRSNRAFYIGIESVIIIILKKRTLAETAQGIINYIKRVKKCTK